LVVPANDNAWDQQAGLISAAHAAASWARARRAQWAAVQPAVAVAPEEAQESDFTFDLTPADRSPHL
jgi:hypothetical protein